ncbi:MAG: alpha/beta hydrolase [Gammaproteobacteria bacterium]
MLMRHCLTACVLLFSSVQLSAAQECVVLLHGLGRVSNSMGELERKMGRAGFDAVNINYPSRREESEVLAADAVGRGISQCQQQGAATIHFVTHSLGGILLRVYLQDHDLPQLGRVVMLGPPNHGSEIVDNLIAVPGFGFVVGPTGRRLGTDGESLPAELGPADFELGIIAGDLNLNPLGFLFFAEANDTIVSVASTELEGMDDHIVLPVTHSLMMRDNEVIDHAIHFLKTGNFIPQPE